MSIAHYCRSTSCQSTGLNHTKPSALLCFTLSLNSKDHPQIAFLILSEFRPPLTNHLFIIAAHARLKKSEQQSSHFI